MSRETSVELNEEDTILIKEINELHYKFDLIEGRKRCEEILAIKPYLYQVRAIYALILSFYDLPQSYKEHTRVFFEQPDFFQNSIYLLDHIFTHYQFKGRDMINHIEDYIKYYEGKKNGYYYLTFAIVYRLKNQMDTSFKYLINNQYKFKNNTIVFAWFQYQLGRHYDFLCTQFESELNLQKSIQFYKCSHEIWPNNIFPLQNLGRIYQQNYGIDNKEIAEQYLNKCLELHPLDGQILFIKGNQLLKEYKHQEAYELYKLSLEGNANCSIIQELMTLLCFSPHRLNIKLENELQTYSDQQKNLFKLSLHTMEMLTDVIQCIS